MATDFSEKHTQNKQNTELPGKTGLTYLALITRSGMGPINILDSSPAPLCGQG